MKRVKKPMIYGSVAQIMIVIFILPVFALIIRLIFGAESGGNVLEGVIGSLIERIPLCDVWVDMLNKYGEGINASEAAYSTVFVIIKEVPETLIMAICVHISIELSKKAQWKGLPIIATFIGIIFATVIISLIGLTHNMMMEILADFCVVIIMIIGINIIFRSLSGTNRIFSVKTIMVFIIDGLLAAVTAGYISCLFLVARGMYGSGVNIVKNILIMSIIEISASVIDLIVNSKIKEKP